MSCVFVQLAAVIVLIGSGLAIPKRHRPINQRLGKETIDNSFERHRTRDN